MKQLKLNKMIPLYVSLLLVSIMSLLVLSTGTTFARYQAERQESIAFEVSEPQMVFLGTIKDDVFVPAKRLEWVVEDKAATLTFAVANGSASQGISARDQAIQLHMLGSLGIGNEGKAPSLSVTFSTPDGSKKTIKGNADAIKKGTQAYHSYGPGWLYSFYDSGKEASCILPGGELNYVLVTVKLRGNLPEYINLLQPIISAEAID